MLVTVHCSSLISLLLVTQSDPIDAARAPTKSRVSKIKHDLEVNWKVRSYVTSLVPPYEHVVNTSSIKYAALSPHLPFPVKAKLSTKFVRGDGVCMQTNSVGPSYTVWDEDGLSVFMYVSFASLWTSKDAAQVS